MLLLKLKIKLKIATSQEEGKLKHEKAFLGELQQAELDIKEMAPPSSKT